MDIRNRFGGKCGGNEHTHLKIELSNRISPVLYNLYDHINISLVVKLNEVDSFVNFIKILFLAFNVFWSALREKNNSQLSGKSKELPYAFFDRNFNKNC